MNKTKQITIKDKHGKCIGVFNCTVDENPLLRLQSGSQKVERALKPLYFIDITADGRAVHHAGRRQIIKAERAIFEAFEALAPGAYNAFFAEIKPFASVGGKFYCENCLEAITQYFKEGENKHGKQG